MNALSNPSLVYLVQLVDQELTRFRSQVEKCNAEVPHLPNVEEELVDCSTVAAKLQRLYEGAEKSSNNMPSYAALTAS